MLGNYPNTAALKGGKLHSDLVDFDFAEVKVANNLFKQIVQRRSMMSVSSRLRRICRPSPTTSLTYCSRPFWSVAANITLSLTMQNAVRLRLPIWLANRWVLRAYTVTTATWVRGILANDYGLDLSKVEWVTFEDPHVVEYRDPRR